MYGGGVVVLQMEIYGNDGWMSGMLGVSIINSKESNGRRAKGKRKKNLFSRSARDNGNYLSFC